MNRNTILAAVLASDPRAVKLRVVMPEKGRGRKDRPRKKRWNSESQQ